MVFAPAGGFLFFWLSCASLAVKTTYFDDLVYPYKIYPYKILHLSRM